jgi:hypothetical protein
MTPIIHTKSFNSTNPRNEPWEPPKTIFGNPTVQPLPPLNVGAALVTPAPPPQPANIGEILAGIRADSDDDLLTSGGFGPVMPTPAPATVPLVTTTTTTPTPQPQLQIEVQPQSIVDQIENDIVELSGEISKEFGPEKSNLAIEFALEDATRELAYSFIRMGYTRENANDEANAPHNRERLKQQQLFILHRMSSNKDMMKKLTRSVLNEDGPQNLTFSKKKTSETHIDYSYKSLQHMNQEQLSKAAESLGLPTYETENRNSLLSRVNTFVRQHRKQ